MYVARLKKFSLQKFIEITKKMNVGRTYYNVILMPHYQVCDKCKYGLVY
jgi:hypothetical protein